METITMKNKKIKSKKGKTLGLILLIGFAVYGILIVFSPTPEFDLPIQDLNEVVGIQVFHQPGGTKVHNGFDFKVENDTDIFSPTDGIITGVIKHQMSNGYWAIDVNIFINPRWSIFIAFEPWTQEESVIDMQMTNITVKFGQIVHKGFKIGVLNPVIGAEFPHIHWNVLELFFDRSPYDYCSPTAKAMMDYLCLKFGQPPAY